MDKADLKTDRPSPSESELSDDPVAKLTPRGIATRNKLMDGARVAFAARGYEGARVADVAKEAGVSLGNFYRHFTDKDDVLFAILQPLYAELRTATGRTANSRPVISEDVLAERNTLYLKFYAKHRAMFRVSREAAASSTSTRFRQMWFEMRGNFIARNRAWLNSLVRAGSAPADMDTTLMADALGNMNEQLAYTRIALANKTPTSAEIDGMARTLAQIWWRSIFNGGGPV